MFGGLMIDPILAEIYSTVLTAAPYVIAAYALMWLVIFGYVLIVTLGLRRTERQLAALEEALAARDAHKSL
jgi:CcmD family protein